MNDCGFEHFPLMSHRLVDGTLGNFLELDQPVAGAEQSDRKDFAIEAAHGPIG